MFIFFLTFLLSALSLPSLLASRLPPGDCLLNLGFDLLLVAGGIDDPEPFGLQFRQLQVGVGLTRVKTAEMTLPYFLLLMISRALAYCGQNRMQWETKRDRLAALAPLIIFLASRLLMAMGFSEMIAFAPACAAVMVISGWVPFQVQTLTMSGCCSSSISS